MIRAMNSHAAAAAAAAAVAAAAAASLFFNVFFSGHKDVARNQFEAKRWGVVAPPNDRVPKFKSARQLIYSVFFEIWFRVPT